MQEDINAFFYEFGEDSIYERKSGIKTDVKVIYDRNIQQSLMSDSYVTNHEHTALVKTEDVDSLAKNCRLKIRNTNYYIIDFMFIDIDELILCVLSKDSVNG